MAWHIDEAVAYYRTQGAPRDQNALVNLLREVQQESGGAVPAGLLPKIAEALSVKESFLTAIIRRYPSLRLADTHTLELCGGPNCSRRANLYSYAEKHCPKKVTLKQVPCMRMCGKGPNLKWDGKLYNGADEALIDELLKNL